MSAMYVYPHKSSIVFVLYSIMFDSPYKGDLNTFYVTKTIDKEFLIRSIDSNR